MSETDNGNTGLPPFGKMVISENSVITGFFDWESVTIHDMPDGSREMAIRRRGQPPFSILLGATFAAHLARLLAPESATEPESAK